MIWFGGNTNVATVRAFLTSALGMKPMTRDGIIDARRNTGKYICSTDSSDFAGAEMR